MLEREKVVHMHKKLLPYLAFKSLYSSGTEWAYIVRSEDAYMQFFAHED